VKILLISGIYPPDDGGPAKFVPQFANYLISQGHKVKVITLTDSKRSKNEFPYPVRFINRSLTRPLRMILTTKYIFLSSIRSDLIFANGLYEETGVATIFESILSFRHSHNIQFGRSDVYIICKLKPTTKTSDLAKVKIDNEIADAKWYFAAIATHSYPRNTHSLIHLIVGSTSTNTSRLISIR
jgi:hypothetical protein